VDLRLNGERAIATAEKVTSYMVGAAVENILSWQRRLWNEAAKPRSCTSLSSPVPQPLSEHDSGQPPGPSEYRKRGAIVTWPRIDWWLPAILSTTAGAVDVIGFLVFGGLFTAHITGNLVVVAAHYVTGGFGQVGPLLAVPVFVAALGLVVLLFGGIKNKGKSRRVLLVLHAALLAGCLVLGVRFGPFRNVDSPVAVLAGMLAVTAMATQNALVKLTLVDSPSTAVMTTNTTQFIIDAAALVQIAEEPEKLWKVRRRASVTFLCMAGFVGGCVAGAVLELHFGSSALALPAILAALAVPLGETERKNL